MGKWKDSINKSEISIRTTDKTLQEFITPEEVESVEHYGKEVDANAVSSANAIGLMQIVASSALNDWNMMHPKETYKREDMFNPQRNTKVGYWYINERIPQLLKFYGVEPTKEIKLAAYNAGAKRISDSIKSKSKYPSETIEYLRRAKLLNII